MSETQPQPAGVKQVMAYFGMTAQEMTKEWRALTDEDRRQIREGIGNDTFTY